MATAAGVALAVLGTACAGAQTVAFDTASKSVTREMQALPVHVGGRVKVEPLLEPMPEGAAAFIHEWPGVYFEAAFRGERVVLKFDDTANEYRLLIDALPAVTLAQPGAAEVTISGLRDGPHSLRLEKLTESIDRPAKFAGFYVPASSRPMEASRRSRQIEFAGDSNMAGYGIRSTKRECSKEEVRLLTDTQAAYPALVAKHFSADYQINAISGRGMVRNYAGELPRVPLPAIYDRTLPSRDESWQDPSWQPQVIVIGLHANDFSTPLKPGEKWADTEALVADFAASYANFLAAVHRQSPDAAMVVVWPDFEQPESPHLAAQAEAAKRTISAAAREAGVRTVLFPVLADLGFERTACDYHASIADQRKLAAWMTAFLEQRPELWQDR